MGFREPTYATCAKCRKQFACGCVIEPLCPECKQVECVHDFLSGEPVKMSGVFCTKCWAPAPEKSKFAELLKLPPEKVASHAQEGWDLANKRTRELGQVKARLMKIVQAWKRGQPASHVVCECKKCAAIIEAIREVMPYDMPGRKSDVF